MFGGQLFLLMMNAWCLRLFTSMVGSFLSSLGISVGRTGGNMMAELMVAARELTTVRNVAGSSSFRGGSFRVGGSGGIMEIIAGTEASIEAILREKHDALLDEIQRKADALGTGCESAVWVYPDQVCTVEYMPNTKNSLCQAVFKGFRTDMIPEDID